MAAVLVFVEHTGGAVKKVGYELLAAASRLGEPVAVIAAGSEGADALVSDLGQHGAVSAYVASDPAYQDYLIAPAVELLAQLVRQSSPAAVLLPADAQGKEIAGRLAVATNSGFLTDVVDLDSDGVASQSIFGGDVFVHSRVRTGTPIFAIRPNSFAPVSTPDGQPSREDVTVEFSPAATGARVVQRVEEEKGERPELSEAQVVVSGGRGVGSAENFAVIEKLADSLHAAVGASRAATDAGWYPHSHQVGQTGVTVSPQLYLAAGISGAIQHRAGMQTSKTIVAVNKDPEAPIFELADFGVVGDLFAVIPQLTEEIAKRS